jgi:hypothetical protein
LASFFKDGYYGERLGEEARQALRKKAWESEQTKFDEESLKRGTTFVYGEEVEFTFSEDGLTFTTVEVLSSSIF